MLSLINKGWVRVRFRKKGYQWILQTKELNNKTKDNIFKWADNMIKNNNYVNSDVFIITNNQQVSHSLKDISNDVLFNESLITESSLSRILKHNSKYDCGAITAFRSEYNRTDNRKRNRKLKAMLMDKGYDIYTLIKGVGLEKQRDGEVYDKKQLTDKGDVMVKEDSFWVVDQKETGELKDVLIELGEYFNQDSILFAPKGAVNDTVKAVLVGTNKNSEWLDYGEEMLFNKGAHFGKTSEIYTSYVNGRPFVFESANINKVKYPSSLSELRIMKKLAQK